MQQFIEKYNIEQGKNNQETLNKIITELNSNLSRIKKKDLEKLAESLDLDSSGTKDAISKRIKSSEDKDDRDTERKVVEKSLEESNITKPVSCYMFDSEGNYTRYLVIIKIPKENLVFNKNTNRLEWTRDSALNRPGKCTNVGFYLSSGTSNESGQNFKGMWFPFMRIQEKDTRTKHSGAERGWIEKVYGLRGGRLAPVEKTLGHKLTDLQTHYLEKFSHWWQVSVASALPSDPESVLHISKELREIRELALHYKMDIFKGLYQDDDIPQLYYIEKPCGKQSDKPEVINEWLKKYDALCSPQDFQ